MDDIGRCRIDANVCVDRQYQAVIHFKQAQWLLIGVNPVRRCIFNRSIDLLFGLLGSIPSKALLTSSEKYHEAMHILATHGVKLGSVTLDLNAMVAHKNKVVKDSTAGIDFLFKKNKVTRFKGKGSIPAVGKVLVTGADGKQETIAAKKILIATGSDVMPLPGVTLMKNKSYHPLAHCGCRLFTAIEIGIGCRADRPLQLQYP